MFQQGTALVRAGALQRHEDVLQKGGLRPSETSHTGVVGQPGNPEALANVIRTFHGMSPSEREFMKRIGREAACRAYNRDLLVSQIGSMLESIAHA